MDNEIKSTLFHFVSMRAPELSSDIELKPNFITQKAEDEGVFNTAIQNITEGNTKMTTLQDEALIFSSSALDVESLKNLNIELYNLSVWLAKNKNKASEAEISIQANEVIDATLGLKVVWNNLFYQIITQKDFYAKEIIMQLLVAHHVCNNSLGNKKERALAKVVLPKELFIDNSSSSELNLNKGVLSEVNFVTPILNNLEKKAISKVNIEVLTRLKAELGKAEKVYKKTYDKQLKKDFKDYQEDIKPILDEHNEAVELAKTTWCSTRPESTLPYDPTDPCLQPPKLAEPVIPEFEFTFMDELDEDFLEEQLSPESFEVFQNLKTPQESEGFFENQSLNRIAIIGAISYDSFESATNSINQLIDAENEILINDIIDNGSTSVIIGGTTTVVPNTAIPLAPFQYEIKTRIKTEFTAATTRTLQIMVGIPEPSWKITAVQYKMTKYDNSFVNNSSTSVVHYIGYDALLNLSMNGITANLQELSITFQFANNRTATILIPDFSLLSIYQSFIPILDDSNEDETSGSDTTINPENNFIPSGFGIKQIGIADYNKVEQSIHGYIEGEVAHVENVMAREYKEKSTRKLRRSEVTETTSSETEKEQLTDTTSVDRFEMQSEVAKVIANSKDFNAGVNATYTGRKYSLSANASLATHNSKEESTRQAVTNAKEITERALDRIVTKVKEERVVKILEEFEENNTHGFDNRKGDKHVVGVYRWVDKVMKNQIINYGKRLMFEFMIPEPARLHKLGMESLINQEKAASLSKPEDPRTATINKLEDYSKINDATIKYWSSKYNFEFETAHPPILWAGKSINMSNGGSDNNIEIKEGYHLTYYKVKTLHRGGSSEGNAGFSVSSDTDYTNNIIGTWEKTISNKLYVGKVPVSAFFRKAEAGLVHFDLKFELNDSLKNKWQQETFNAIINAYEDALEKYNEALATEQTNGVQILGTNPGFYREIENTVLRKNCISYLVDSNPNAKRTFGKNFYKQNNSDIVLNFSNAKINQNAELDDYASFVKFMEQAFEWEIMSYNFYPYYWGSRPNWLEMYQYDQTHDHIFKAFMQSGMARVIVTVRPGFEEAARYYMQTGQIWNGGEVPVIGDELFLSIVDELQKPEGEKVGKAWPTRIPTSMTILQAQSIGLNVTKALPFNEDLSDFENPDEVPQSSQIDFNNAQIGGGNSNSARIIGKIESNINLITKIRLNKADGAIQDLTSNDDNGNWEINNLPAGEYELIIDYDNDYASNNYLVMTGSKQQTVELIDDQIIEINISFEQNGSF